MPKNSFIPLAVCSTPIPAAQLAEHAPSRVSSRLTKKFLLAAPTGRYLVSNIGINPIFAEVIAPSIPERLGQWVRAVLAGADGRLCFVYRSREEHDCFRRDFFAHHQKLEVTRVERPKMQKMQ